MHYFGAILMLQWDSNSDRICSTYGILIPAKCALAGPELRISVHVWCEIGMTKRTKLWSAWWGLIHCISGRQMGFSSNRVNCYSMSTWHVWLIVFLIQTIYEAHAIEQSAGTAKEVELRQKEADWTDNANAVNLNCKVVPFCPVNTPQHSTQFFLCI